MDDTQVGRALRAVRQRSRLRQRDVAGAAGVSQSQVSMAEAGRLEELTVAALRRIACAVGIRLPFRPQWRGSDVYRLLDEEHSALVERVVADLGRLGWRTVLEYGFNHYGERGSVDVLAWHPTFRALLVVEVKSRLVDLQDLFRSVARKARIVPTAARRELGWDPIVVGRLIVVAESTGNRAQVERHQASFANEYPLSGWPTRRWLAKPIGPFAGRLFLPAIAGGDGTRGRRRVLRVRADTTRPTTRPAGASRSWTSTRGTMPVSGPAATTVRSPAYDRHERSGAEGAADGVPCATLAVVPAIRRSNPS